MPKDMESKVRITADTKQAQGALNDISKAARGVGDAVEQTERKTRRAQSGMAKFVTFLRSKFVVTFGDVMRAVEATFRAIQNTITLEGQEVALRGQLSRMGADFDTFLARLDEAAKGTVATADLIGASSRALLLGIPADEIADLLEIAGSRARATGDTVAKAFDDITLGIGRGSKMILDNLGFIIDIQGAYEETAVSIGKTTEQLTVIEKRTAVLNEVLRQGKRDMEALGDASENVFLQLQQGQAAFVNFKTLLSDILTLLGVSLSAVLSRTAGRFTELWKQMANGVDALASMGAHLPFVGKRFEELGEKTRATADYFAGLDMRVDEATDGLEGLAEGLAASVLGLDEQSKAVGRTTEASSAYIREMRGIKDAQDEVKTTTDDLTAKYEEQVPAVRELSRENERLLGVLQRLEQVPQAGVIPSEYQHLRAKGGLRQPRNQQRLEDALRRGIRPHQGGRRIKTLDGGSILLEDAH